jgi:Mrp family chromosome partitioning ATPase
MNNHPTPASAEPFRFEPTVFGAMRRYRTMVLVVAVLVMAAAIGYTLKQPKMYRAQASVTVPQQISLQGQQVDPSQYLDSQVLLLQSQDVAQRAAAIANARLRGNRLAADNFFGADSSLQIVPPTTATPGSYGASIVAVSFTWPSARIAQVGANTVLQAYNDARSATIKAQGDATVAGIDQASSRIDRQLASIDQQLAITAPDNSSAGPSPDTLRLQRQRLLAERGALLTRRVQAVVNEQIDLAQHPTVGWADEPATPANRKLPLAGGIGLVIGIILGGALAFARASRRRDIADRQDPAALYGAPLIGEIPAFEAERTWRWRGTPARGLQPMAADPHSAAAEAFRFAAGSVERVRATHGPRLSLVFVSPLAGSGKSTVVANLALALAEGGTRVLVVDGDAADGDLTARLLPGSSTIGGFEQVLAGRRALADYVQPSPFNGAVAVLGCGPAAASRLTGAARAKAVRALLTEAKASFDVVLIDSPALLQVADAPDLVEAADAAIIVLSPNEPIRDHLEVVDRLNLIRSDVLGYIYNRAPTRPHHARYQRYDSLAPPGSPAVTPPPPVLVRTRRPLDGESRPSSQPSAW